jgi:hypothetical protein
MDIWLIASLWVGLALISAMISIRLGISVALRQGLRDCVETPYDAL